MRENPNKSNQDENRSMSNDSMENKGIEAPSSHEDNSPEALKMRQLQNGIDGSDEVAELTAFDKAVEKHETAPDDGDSSKKNTNIPDNIKNGIESLSGISLDGVTVHYNSNKPCYTYITVIHIYIYTGTVIPDALEAISISSPGVKPEEESASTTVAFVTRMVVFGGYIWVHKQP